MCGNICVIFTGSGKTSLLDVIAHRTDAPITGKITLNNFECTPDFIKQSTAYVIQADRLLYALTVKETLNYAAFLRLPGNMSKAARDKRVSRLDNFICRTRFNDDQTFMRIFKII